ncbi:hypothetical protein SAMN05444280_1771 [Tangfeifania diversioriginum]|uniref:Uncharacterized protein n=1 Tax=Tangfeifania diversioriginum TaxID=1168035 RepID=A0A1M6PW21_9BACT|nr:hypothetical protein SAMN05444280_1771 [Tangfeifania diversioriginum]
MRSFNAPYIAPAGTKPLTILSASKSNNSTPGYPAVCWLANNYSCLFCTLMIHVCKINLNDKLKNKH